MPKDYYCNKAINGETCGETNPDKFETGRYSTCKRCRNKQNSEYQKLKKDEELETKYNKIDPSLEIRSMLEDLIKDKPFINGISILKKFEEVDENNTETLMYCTNKIEKLEKIIESKESILKILLTKIESLELKIKDLEK